MKTIAIGDGLKTIQLPSSLFIGYEDDNLLFYEPDIDLVTGRLSVITVEHKTLPNKDLKFNDTPQRAEAKGVEFQERGKVRFFEYSQRHEKSDEPIVIHYVEASINNHIVIISATIDQDKTDHPKSLRFLEMIREAAFTIKDLTGEDIITSDLLSIHTEDIAKRLKQVEEYAKSNTKLTCEDLDNLAPHLPFDPDDHTNWFNFGTYFGQILVDEFEGFNWKLHKDEYGLAYCISFANTSIKVFPCTMFTNRKEDGVEFSVIDIYNGVIDAVGKSAKEGC